MLLGVITGDLINSTQVAESAEFRLRLQELLGLIGQRYDAVTATYRGDGFQVAMAQQSNLFEAALLLRAGLIARSPGRQERWDARIAMAFGEGKLPAPDQNSAVYVNSGRTLDQMKTTNLEVFGEDELMGLAFSAATRFADDIVNSWTSTEAEVVFLYLQDRPNHEAIARQLGKKRPTITKALLRARYSLIDRYVREMNRMLELFYA